VKLLFDHNLSFRLVRRLEDLYPGSTHTGRLGLGSALDPAVWRYAGEHGLCIVSKDSDFRDLAVRLGHPPKVVWLRLGNCSTRQVEAVLRRRHADLLRFEIEPGSSILEIF
jgi:predicted nuclease of predicted toxin-antitoxin system